MTDAREIIARAREESRDKSDLGVLLYQAIAWPSEACGTALMDENLHDWQVRAAISALTAAGFRVLTPEEVDPVTVEKCAAIADEHTKAGCTTPDGSQTSAMRLGAASIAAALRALKEKQG